MTSAPVDETPYVILRPLIAQARAEGKWLYCRYAQVWFSPNDLVRDNRNGSFCWGPDNFELRHPAEYLVEKEAKVREATDALERAQWRVAKAEGRS